MKPIIPIFLIIILFVAISCKKDPDGPKQPKPVYLPEKGAEVIAKSNGFGVDLFRVTSMEVPGNLMLSPLSASTALTMLLNGCNSQTYDQVRDMLGYQGLTQDEINDSYNSLIGQLLVIDPEIDLALANAVWYRQDFQVRPSFLSVMDSSFQAETGALDFMAPSALSTINGWASDNTNGKIPKVLDEIDPGMVMFLMNALYFKGNWTYQFDKDQTSPGPFHLADGSTVQVDMMRKLVPARMVTDSQATAVELNYGQQNFSMVVIVTENDLDEYMEEFDGTAWLAVTTGLDALPEPEEVDLSMPKFKFEFEKYLNDQLISMGMVDAFDPMLADLSGIADADIYVDFVKQNTFVDVNEEGTEAAAVTTIGIKEVSMPEAFVVDKPFIFAIRERMTNTLLFIGKVERPAY